MEDDSNDPLLTAVAGCLFEVSLPERDGASWSLAEPAPEATLVSESLRGARRHFRFRAEEAAAVAGSVSLRFRSETAQRGMSLRLVEVPVAPEH
ncbi:MAG TPA: hypothetical protein VNT52_11875 [Acidimicrobiales bacterium]|nr:hypothetical protein [Acidimicrobiales bacterium]